MDNTGWPYPSKGVIDAKSHASGFDDPLSIPSGPTRCEPMSEPTCPIPSTTWARTWGQPPPLPGGPKNRLDVSLTNLRAATVDASRAGLDPRPVMTVAVLANDSPCRLTIAGRFARPLSVTGAGFEWTPQGVVLILQPGPALVTIRPGWHVGRDDLGGEECYPNCDQSTVEPVLNINDFNCFVARFAAGDAYANCDGSSTPPTLNILDFNCFATAFAAGCSAP